MKALADSLGIALSGHAGLRLGDRLRPWHRRRHARRRLGGGQWAGPHIANFLGAQGRRARRGAGAADLRDAALSDRLAGADARAARRHLAADRRLAARPVRRPSPPALVVRHGARALQLPRWTPGCWPTFLFVAFLADAVGGLKPVTTTLDQIAFTIGSRRLSLLILIQILVALARALRGGPARQPAGRPVDPARHRPRSDPAAAHPEAGAIVIIAIAFFVGIDLAGIDLTALAVFSGALGLAVGFGLQKTFGNLIAGIILLMDRSIKPGDVISVGESFGSVNKIGVRAVSIVTRDGKEYLIPNEILMTQEVVNWSYSTRDVRISIPIGIAYDCDVKLAHKLMVEAATASPRVLEQPKPVVWMTALRRECDRPRDPGLDRAIRRRASAASARRSSSRLLELFARAWHPRAEPAAGHQDQGMARSGGPPAQAGRRAAYCPIRALRSLSARSSWAARRAAAARGGAAAPAASRASTPAAAQIAVSPASASKRRWAIGKARS